MGRKLDLGELGDAECEHILEVLNRDFRLRQLETERLQQQEKELKEEALKTALLEKQRAFNKKSTCIRCLDTFPVLSYWKLALCPECNYNVCRRCSELDSTVRKWTCFVCVKTRDLRVQTLSWFYDNVKARFRRYGSAKVVRSLYKRKSGATSDSEYDSGYDPSQASSLSRRVNGAARETPTAESLFVRSNPELSSASQDPLTLSSNEGPADGEFDFAINANIRSHIERFHEGLRANIEELREALADFLNDDDFESDRFKRMLYTFSLKFAGVLKQIDSGLRRDMRGVEKGQVKASARRAVSKLVENLMGVDIEGSDGAMSQRDADETDQRAGELIVYKVLKDFKQEAADYCEVLDSEDGMNRGDGFEGEDGAEVFDRSRKESEEFHQLEAHFRGALSRPRVLPSFGSVDFSSEAADGDFNENVMFAAKSQEYQRRDSLEAVAAAEAVAKDLSTILEGLPETGVDDDDDVEDQDRQGDPTRLGSRQILEQHVKYLASASSDENELEDILEEEESDDDDDDDDDEEEEGKLDTVKEKILRRSVEGSERDTASEGGDDVDLADDSSSIPASTDVSGLSVGGFDDAESGGVRYSGGDAFYGGASGGSDAAKSRVFDHASSMYVPVPDRQVVARIGSRDAVTYADSIDSNLSRTSSLDETDFAFTSGATNSDQLKALSSEIIERFSKMESVQSEESEDDSENHSPRADEDTAPKAVVLERRKSTYATRVSNPSSEDPQFLVIPEDAEVARGEEARFECVVVASGLLDVFWFADEGGLAGKEMEESVKYALDSSEGAEEEEEKEGHAEGEDVKMLRTTTHRLRIFDVSESDAGRYYCVCVNARGRNASIFQVVCRPNGEKSQFRAPIFTEQMVDVRSTEGESASFRCRVVGYPKPRVVFQREGELVRADDKIKVLEESEDAFLLRLEDVTFDSEGRYVAFAVNAAGAMECAAHLTVDPKPMKRTDSFRQMESPRGVASSSTPAAKPRHLPLSPPLFTPIVVSPGARAVASELQVDVNELNKMAADVDSERLQILQTAEELFKEKVSVEVEEEIEIIDDLQSAVSSTSMIPGAVTAGSSFPPSPKPAPRSRTGDSASTQKEAPVAAPRPKKSEKNQTNAISSPASKDSLKTTTTTTTMVDPLAALRPSSRPSSAGSLRGRSEDKAKPASRLAEGEAFVIPDDEDEDDETAIPGTWDLRKSSPFARKDSSRRRYKRDYYVNRKSIKGARGDLDKDDDDVEASSIPSTPTSSSSPRKEGDEDDLDDLYVIPSVGHDKKASYAGVDDDDEDDRKLAEERRRRGDGSSSFGSSTDVDAPSSPTDNEPHQQRKTPSSGKKALPSVRELSAIWDRRGSSPTVSTSVVEDFLRMGSITGRSLTKKGRELIQDVVRPSSASNPVRRTGNYLGSGDEAGSTNTSLASSLRSSFRSSIRSFAGMRVSNVDEDRTTPDGASIGGVEGEEQGSGEEENAIFV